MRKEAYGKTSGKKVYVYDSFKGVDYARAPANVSPHRCVDGMNMVRSEVGKVQKRTGFEYDAKVWPGNINGVHFLQKEDETVCLVHCGTDFYIGDEVVYAQAGDNHSRAVQLKDRLYILDGKSFVVFDGKTVKPVKDEAFIPLTCVNRRPDGGGREYQQANMLTSFRQEGFIADGQSTLFSLTQPYIGTAAVTAIVKNDDGTVTAIQEGSGLTVDRTLGNVTFSSAPPLSKITDRDNVFITYEKANGGDISMLDKCTVITVFGPGGRPDTLFLSGNPEYPGREWFSQPDNPGFFGVHNTDLAGSDNSPVTGYSVKDDQLFVHRNNNERGLNILVRSCSGGDSNHYSYPVAGALQGPDTIGCGTFVNMANDALFLTENGVYAITKTDVSQNHYTQLRSLFINKKLLGNKNLSKATAVAFNDFYVIAMGNDIYLLDTLQKSYEADKEYSNYQYECYHWRINNTIKLLFVQDNRLCFATDDGRIGRFYTDYENPNSFNDDGHAIEAVWQTGEFVVPVSAKLKDIYSVWVVCATALRTGVIVQAQINGIWKEIFRDMVSARYFRWSAIQWSKFTWSTDETPKIIKRRARIRNIYKTAFRLENKNLDEPFGVYELGLEYISASYSR